MIWTVLDWACRIIATAVMASCGLLLALAMLAARAERKHPDPGPEPMAPWRDDDFIWAEKQGFTVPEGTET